MESENVSCLRTSALALELPASLPRIIPPHKTQHDMPPHQPEALFDHLEAFYGALGHSSCNVRP